MELCLPSRFIWATRLPWSHQFKAERGNISGRTVTANANERAYRPTHTQVIQSDVHRNSNSPGAVNVDSCSANGNWCTFVTGMVCSKNALITLISHFLPNNHGTRIISPPVTSTAVKLLLCFITFLSSSYTWCQMCRDVIKAPIEAEMLALATCLEGFGTLAGAEKSDSLKASK